VAVAADWIRGSSPLKGALLGLLIQSPGHGYDLANRLNRRLGPTWQVDPKETYRPLERLERDGLALATDARQGRSARKVYSPTALAEGAFSEWMSAGSFVEPIRTHLQAKLAVARMQDLPALLDSLDVYERDCLVLCASCSGDTPPTDTLLGVQIHLERKASFRHLRAELDWIVDARRLLSELRTSP
jgi:DNA-binding PadR family transcriptional regulator